VWTFRNEGTDAWPIDTKIVYTNGDKFGPLEHLIGPVDLNELVDITIEFTAPEKAGKYCSFYRLTTGDNVKFGQKVWCDILVTDEDSEIHKL